MTDTTQPPAETLAATYEPSEAEVLAARLDESIAFKVYSSSDDHIRDAAAMLRRFSALTRRAGGDAIAPDAPQCAQSCGDPRWCTDAKACWRTNEWRDGAIRARVSAGGDAIPAGWGEMLRESAAKHAVVCAKLANETPIAGEPDPLWWERQSAIREAAVILAHVGALPTPKPPAGGDAGAVRVAAEALLQAMTIRALRGRDHVPSMREEQKAQSALAAALALPAPVVERE